MQSTSAQAKSGQRALVASGRRMSSANRTTSASRTKVRRRCLSAQRTASKWKRQRRRRRQWENGDVSCWRERRRTISIRAIRIKTNRRTGHRRAVCGMAAREATGARGGTTRPFGPESGRAPRIIRPPGGSRTSVSVGCGTRPSDAHFGRCCETDTTGLRVRVDGRSQDTLWLNADVAGDQTARSSSTAWTMLKTTVFAPMPTKK